MLFIRVTLLASVCAGCGLNSDGGGPWTPLDQIEAPLIAEANLAEPPSPFRANHPVGTDEFRIVTYNTEVTIDPEKIIEAIESTPDLASAGVIVLQESEMYPDEPSSRVKPIAERLGLNYAYVPEFEMSPGHTQGVSILSAYPIENVMRMQLPFMGTHPRAALSADIIVGDHTIHIVTVHLELRTNAAQRLIQLRPAIIDAPETTIVAGDFNMVPVEWLDDPGIPVLSGTDAVEQSKAVDSYMAALHFAAPTQGSGPTSGKYGIWARIDAIYTRGLGATAGAAPHVGPSDHWPLWADIQP
jgi:endonuclease/exonuclease/phosphatase family metal-dependent hydrolase